jgi:hypothetical protein
MHDSNQTQTNVRVQVHEYLGGPTTTFFASGFLGRLRRPVGTSRRKNTEKKAARRACGALAGETARADGASRKLEGGK